MGVDLGHTDYRWNDIYLYGNFYFTSHSSAKRDISDSTFGREFINRLRPRKYKMGHSNPENFGFIAEEVRDVLKNDERLPFDGEKTESFNGYKFAPGRTLESITDEEKEEGTITDKSGNKIERWRSKLEDKYFLDYTSFIAPMVKAVQEIDTKWIPDQEGNTYKTSGTVAIGTTPLTGTPLRLYGGGGNLDATILRIEGKNRNMNGSGGIVDFQVNSDDNYSVVHKITNAGYTVIGDDSTKSLAFGTNNTERIVIRGTGSVLTNGEPVLTLSLIHI